MKSVFVTIIGVALVSTANAGREIVKCVEQDEKPQIRLSLDFDPTVSIETVWKNDDKGGNYIETTKVGDQDANGFTTAKVVMTVPRDYYNGDEYTGRFPFTDFYGINIQEAAGSGYSYKFNDGPHTSFHGHDKDMKWDMMVYLAAPEIRKANKTYTGLMTIQPDMADQGYYHIDMTCTSKFVN